MTTPEKLGESVGIAILFAGSIFVVVIFGTLVGALAGLVVGWVFGGTILGILGQLGVHDVAMWQFGAFLGFVGGFLKTKVSK
jgi:hypothetical protein